MASSSGAAGRATGGGRRPRRQLNPSFAAAHGLQSAPPPSVSSSLASGRGASGGGRGGGGGRGRSISVGGGGAHQSGRGRIDAAARSARSTGRLNLSDANLTVLPESIFDLRNGIEIDLSLDSDANPGRWQSHGEDELTTVDFSDNDFQSGVLDDRIDRFKSVKSFRARRCNLERIPWRSVASLDQLLVLDLSGNGRIEFAILECLPLSLREIDLSGNQLTRLTEGPLDPEEQSGDGPRIVLPNLISLDVSDNVLTALPSSMEVPALQTLRFGGNKIACIPEDLVRQASKALSEVDGSGNDLTSVPDLTTCRNLKVVDLSDNSLSECPAVPPTLVRLCLNNNAIASLGSMFSDVAKRGGSETFRSDLTELRLRRNKLSDLDETVMRALTKVALIDVGENDLRDVPHVLGYQPELRRLTLDGNRLRVIRTALANDTRALKDFLRKRGPPPVGADYLAAPSEINGTSNGADGGTSQSPTTTADEARGLVNDALVGARTLQLSGRRLGSSPPESLRAALAADSTCVAEGGTCVTGARIRKLDVSGNELAALDGWIEVLPNLTSIDAERNRIGALPNAGLSELALTELLLGRNRLTADAVADSALCRRCARVDGGVPPTIPPLAANLTRLDLSGNALEWFPSGLCSLPALSCLVLSNNAIRSLATTTGDDERGGWRPGLPRLDTLDLSDNKIADLGNLPRDLASSCPMLRTLLLQNNELSRIPPALGLLNGLNSIDLRGNPQRGIRPGVLEKSCAEIVDYLRGRMDPSELQGQGAEASSRSAATGVEASSSSGATNSTMTADSSSSSAKVDELRQKIDEVTLQMNNVHLTEAKKYALKKTLAVHKANLIKEERRLRMQGGG